MCNMTCSFRDTTFIIKDIILAYKHVTQSKYINIEKLTRNRDQQWIKVRIKFGDLSNKKRGFVFTIYQ